MNKEKTKSEKFVAEKDAKLSNMKESFNQQKAQETQLQKEVKNVFFGERF